jgi:hypothetical protein
LEVVGTNPVTDEVIVMSGFGHAADWFQNLQAAPAVEVAIGRRRFIPQPDPRRDRSQAVLADYERRNRLLAPIVRRVLSRLVGWPYDGSNAARTRHVRQLPMVGLRPLNNPDSPCAH